MYEMYRDPSTLPAKMLRWDRARLERFKKAQAQACQDPNSVDSFFFEEGEFHCRYAAYLIEFLEANLSKGENYDWY